MSVSEALRRELKGRAPSALTELALVLAARVDDPGTAATAVAACAKALDDVLRRVFDGDPVEVDGLDELARRRSGRRSAKDAPAG